MANHAHFFTLQMLVSKSNDPPKVNHPRATKTESNDGRLLSEFFGNTGIGSKTDARIEVFWFVM